jgi:hypothetical protein
MMEILISDISSLKESIEKPKPAHIEPEITHTTPILPQTLPLTAPQVEPLYIAKQQAMLLNNSKQAMQEFHELFGVQVPIGSDIDKVTEMVRRKKAGQIEHVKSPLRYLDKVTPLVTVPTSAPTTPTTCRPLPGAVDMRMIELAKKADEMWEKMGDGERKPFMDHASRKERTPSRWNPPVEALARSEFKRQILQQHGVMI